MIERATPAELVDYLTYSNYAHNRNLAPHITPERWKKVYGADAVDRMEPIYLAASGQGVAHREPTGETGRTTGPSAAGSV